MRTPRQIRRSTRMPPMNKHQLRRSILGVFRGLLEADFGYVPEVYTTVARGGGKDGFVCGGPGELEDFFGVGFEGVELELEVAEVPEGDGLGEEAGQRRDGE